MTTFKTEAKVEDDGSIQICGLPFAPGESVEVIVKAMPIKPVASDSATERYPLRGLANDDNYHYYLPFEPADQEDWESLLETVSPYEREGRLELLEPEYSGNPADDNRE